MHNKCGRDWASSPSAPATNAVETGLQARALLPPNAVETGLQARALLQLKSVSKFKNVPIIIGSPPKSRVDYSKDYMFESCVDETKAPMRSPVLKSTCVATNSGACVPEKHIVNENLTNTNLNSKCEEIYLDDDDDNDAYRQQWINGLEGLMIKESIATLNAGQWLNDEVVHCSFRFIQESSNLKIGCLFNYQIESLFFERPSTLWHLDMPLDSYHLLLIPGFVDGNHWIFIGVDVSRRKIIVYDSDNKKKVIAQRNQECADKVKKVLIANASSSGIQGFNEWEISEMFSIPKQNNSYDCGIYSIMFAHSFVNNIPMFFSPEDISRIRINLKNFYQNYSMSNIDNTFSRCLQINIEFVSPDALRKRFARSKENDEQRNARLSNQSKRKSVVRENEDGQHKQIEQG
jgi:hypothetical protein